jgi:CheY-specific phosphatase CheX
MQQPATTSLFQAATSTFESLALLFPEPCSVEGAEFIPLAAAFSVTYHGDQHGRVVVGVTTGVLPALAENMLGAAAAPDPQLQRDALGELVNVVTGNVLPMVHGATAVFRLDAPLAAGDEPFKAHAGETQVGFSRLQMDEGEAILAMFERDGAPAGASPVTAAARA